MKRNNCIFIILCIALLYPSVATAQFFEKQKVVVWNILDRNNDVKVSQGTKQQIRTGIVDAFVNSQNYEAFECNMDDVVNKIRSKGLSPSPTNIAVTVYELYKADYVLFTTIRIKEHSNSYNDFLLNLSSELISTDTQKSERMYDVDLKSDVNEIPSACAELLSGLIRERISASSVQSQSRSNERQYNEQPVRSQRPQDYTETAFGLNLNMVYVEGGTFTMGATAEQDDAYDDEKPAHNVHLDGFYISKLEITQAQWKAVMGTDIYNKANGNSLFGVGSNYPMYYITWHDAVAFCRELSVQTGKTYLLPTEAQWEYAARGGNKSRGNKYSGSYAIDAVAWYDGNSSGTTHPVGQLRANELGLYDMSGNVWEWCRDWYGSYAGTPQTNPTGAYSGDYKVVRGGSWSYNPRNVRVSSRNNGAPTNSGSIVGFRVVCLP